MQYASDIHLDIRDSYCLEQQGEILILAGDIGQPFKPNYEKFLRSLGHRLVLLISGNHEYYSASHTKEQIDQKLASYCQLPNIVPLQMQSYDLGDLLVLGTTLWSKIQDSALVESSMSDYQRIRVKQGQIKRKISAEQTRSWHQQELGWLLDQLEANRHRRIMIVTHHAPSFKSCKIRDPLTQAYATDLEWICEKYSNLEFWIHGHVHDQLDYKINQCRVLCNAIGYSGQGRVATFLVK